MDDFGEGIVNITSGTIKYVKAGYVSEFGQVGALGEAHAVRLYGRKAPTPYTLHPTPYTLHPTPYTLHLTPYTLHPTPYTLQKLSLRGDAPHRILLNRIKILGVRKEVNRDVLTLQLEYPPKLCCLGTKKRSGSRVDRLSAVQPNNARSHSNNVGPCAPKYIY